MFKKFITTVAITTAFIFTTGNLQADDNLGDGYESSDASSLRKTQGQVLCTASVNSDGTLVATLNGKASTTTRVSMGRYQVGFGLPCNNIKASRGFSRWVQPDTLTTGSTGAVFCTTADRAGVISAVWVACYDLDGNPKDTSFFLFIAQ